MIIKELIQEYEMFGIHLWLENEKLKFRAEKGTLTEERKQKLVEHKSEIIEFLSKRDKIVMEHKEETQFEPFQLTDIQAAYNLHRLVIGNIGNIINQRFYILDFQSQLL